MPMSDWGDWLARTVAEADPDGVAVWYLGCNGFILKDGRGTTLFIDPYLGIGDPPRTIRMLPIPFDPGDIREAAAILVTHEHTDHTHGPSQAPILAQTGARLYGPGGSIDIVGEESWQDRWDVAEEQLVVVTVGEEFEIGDFSVTVGPANDPDAGEPVSYVIEHAAGTVFHGGDTKPTDVFASIGSRYDIDLAIVAFGSEGKLLDRSHERRSRTRWYCDENEAVRIVNDLQADRMLPSHWDMWKGVGADPTALHRHITSWNHPRTLEIVEIGDRVDL